MNVLDVLLETELRAQLEVTLLALARAATCVALLPMLGSKQVSNLVRMGVVLVVALVLLPSVERTGLAFPLQLMQAVGFGVVIGLNARLVWELFLLPLALVDIATGRGSMGGPGLFDGGQEGAIQTLGNLAFLAIFSSLGLHLTAMQSWLTLRPESPFSLAPEALVDLFSLCFSYAVAIAAPALAAALLVDATLGWANRTLSSLPAMFIAMPARSIVGWLLVPATLAAAAFAFQASGSEVLATLFQR